VTGSVCTPGGDEPRHTEIGAGRGWCLNKISGGFDLLHIHKTTANPSDIEHEITVDFKQENTVANDLIV
jgi:hypothetical protein